MQLRRALTRAGLSVVGIATNGREAVETTLRERPDIVLMDIRMPVMDGITAARQILQQHRVCIVMLTAFSNEEYQQQARSIGATGYIVKPITSDVLMPMLQRALNEFDSQPAN
jgi:response regulator NasT